MPANDAHFRELFRKYSENQATAEERAELFELINIRGNDQLFAELMLKELEDTAPQANYEQAYWDVIFRELIDKTSYPSEVKQIRQLIWRKLAIAASLLIAISVVTHFIFTNPASRKLADQSLHDVSPFTAMAILKSGGKTIILDKTGNGKIAQTNITKSLGEQLIYQEVKDNQVAVYDTIQIPSGGRPYTIKLSDGSKITLNAATTLRYPESFSKNRKEVIELISGEVYADVVHNSDAPLEIKAPGQLIRDFGTSFNINAYTDEDDKRTTLVEGSISVNEIHLKPGQQTVLFNKRITIQKADLDQVTAWKSGDFYFYGEHIDVIMRQLARWYNIEVKYEGKMSNEVFYAQIARKKNISEVLRMLEKTQKVKFKIQGKEVTVSSKS